VMVRKNWGLSPNSNDNHRTCNKLRRIRGTVPNSSTPFAG